MSGFNSGCDCGCDCFKYVGELAPWKSGGCAAAVAIEDAGKLRAAAASVGDGAAAGEPLAVVRSIWASAAEALYRGGSDLAKRPVCLIGFGSRRRGDASGIVLSPRSGSSVPWVIS
ncbi:hypothetical protein Vafri_6881 [Volvox africanus]|uniref:Uncharacterized protein n=1 Tax=Volvox africanus TaxID=51714 RepID=A0A8J4B005_9CHLO|nr:hypothetical protein Vafri_6881 [Volvox africanus]